MQLLYILLPAFALAQLETTTDAIPDVPVTETATDGTALPLPTEDTTSAIATIPLITTTTDVATTTTTAAIVATVTSVGSFNIPPGQTQPTVIVNSPNTDQKISWEPLMLYSLGGLLSLALVGGIAFGLYVKIWKPYQKESPHRESMFYASPPPPIGGIYGNDRFSGTSDDSEKESDIHINVVSPEGHAVLGHADYEHQGQPSNSVGATNRELRNSGSSGETTLASDDATNGQVPVQAQVGYEGSVNHHLMEPAGAFEGIPMNAHVINEPQHLPISLEEESINDVNTADLISFPPPSQPLPHVPQP